MNYCFSSFISIRNNDFDSSSFKIMTWSTFFLLVENSISFDWNICSYFFNYFESSVVVMLFISYLVRSIKSISRITSQFSFVIQYVSLVSSFVVWSSFCIVCSRVLVLSSLSLNSLKFEFSILIHVFEFNFRRKMFLLF